MTAGARSEASRDWLRQELRDLRLRHGAYHLADRELARRAGLHVEQARRWLYGDCLPSRATQAKFARLLQAVGASEQEQTAILTRLGFDAHPAPPLAEPIAARSVVGADSAILFDLESPQTGRWEVAAWAGSHTFRSILQEGRQVPRHPALSRDGRLVVTVEERPSGAQRLELWSSGRDRLVWEREAPLMCASRGAWSPDGQAIGCQVAIDQTGRSSAIVRYDLESDRCLRLTWGDHADAAPCWSPCGSYLAFQRDGALWAVDVEGRRQWPLLDRGWGGGRRLASPAFSPDGERLAFMQRQDRFTSALCCLDLSSGKAEVIVGSPGVRRLDPCWSPDGERLLYASNVATRHYFELWLCAADGSDRQQLSDYRGNVARPTWQRLAR